MIKNIIPYICAFASSLLFTLFLTPVVRELVRRLGMVDKPDPRRINKTPIPRGGGLAVVLGVLLPYSIFIAVTGRQWIAGFPDLSVIRLAILSVAMAVIGFVDDKFSLKPGIKLLGQLIIAFLVWWWANLGFNDIWPSIPVWVDCLLTVLWVVGAVNAFNLIDGLDGLASGIALIATLGMAGSLFFVGRASSTPFYFAFVGALLGFLRYNYNPASVFLGDSGSMFIGFIVATLPFTAHSPNSFLVSVGVPLLAMGVPIFDTALAILRRSLRRLLGQQGKDLNSRIMSADSDHLHHRILRSVGMNQRRAAWVLYGVAATGVLVGITAMTLESRSGGLWLAAFTIATILIVRDFANIELYDAGRLLNSVAHDERAIVRRRLAGLSSAFLVSFDVIALTFSFLLCCWLFRVNVTLVVLRTALPIAAVSVFVAVVVMRGYKTVWARAVASNYMRLFTASIIGSVAGMTAIYYVLDAEMPFFKAMSVAYALVSFFALAGVRMLRSLLRDVFYALDCSRLKGRKDVSRILVYGAGLRYRAFRRGLVRSASANSRIIVGLIDDDILLCNKYIGGIKVMGSINDVSRIINETNADAVVIACDMSPQWRLVVDKLLASCDVKVTEFTLSETGCAQAAKETGLRV